MRPRASRQVNWPQQINGLITRLRISSTSEITYVSYIGKVYTITKIAAEKTY